MFALDGQTGAERWFAPHIVQFCSVSASHVYAIDHLDRLTILDSQRGTRLATLPLGDVQIKMLNQQTDRIYLASDPESCSACTSSASRSRWPMTPPRLKAKHRQVRATETRRGQGRQRGLARRSR